MTTRTLVARDRERAAVLAASAEQPHAAVLVTGPRGVGRSALAAAVAAAFEADGRRTLRVNGRVATRTAPLAAMAPLVPQGADPGDPATVTAVLRLLAAAPRSRAVVVDDVDLLDPASEAVVVGAIVQRAATVVLTCPAGSLPPSLERLVGEGRLEVVDLAPLDAGSTAALVEQAGLPVPDQLDAALAGLPALAVAAARDLAAGEDPDQVGPRLAAAAERHLDRCTEDERACLELLAATTSLPVGVVTSRHERATVESLEAAGRVAVDRDPGGLRVSLTDPRDRDVVRLGLGELARTRLRFGVAPELAAAGDPARAATWLLDAGASVDVDLLLAGGEAALRGLDTPTALRLAAEAFHGHEAPGPATLLYGTALARAGRAQEAEQVLGAAASGETPAALVRARAHNLAMGLADPHRAIAVLEEAVARDDAELGLCNDIALYASLAGETETVLACTDRVLAQAPPGPVRLVALANRGLAEVLRGRLAAAAALRDEARRLLDDHAATVPMVPVELAMQELLDALARDNVDDALAVARRTVDATAGSPDGALLGLLALAHVLHRAGDLEQAAEVIASWSNGRATADPFAMDPQMRPSLLALVSAERNAPDVAAGQLRRVGNQPITPRSRPWIAWAEAAIAFQRGDVETGVEVVLDAAARLRADRHLVWAGEVLEVAVRMGAPAQVLDELAELAAEVPEVARVQLALRLARALVAGDDAELLAVGRRAAGQGVWLLAQEAAMHAAAIATTSGDERAAARASTCAAGYGRHVHGADTPALRLPVERLTDRQVEVAVRAATATSQEIADELHIATRTVENHLQAAYRGLGITGRDELAALLAPA